MASRPDDDENYEIDRDTGPARETVEELADGEEAAVDTAITRLPPG